MGLRVIHFGCDDCYRVHVLKNAGYDVQECASIMHLQSVLQGPIPPAAVFVSDSAGTPVQEAALVTRTTSSVPLILFCGSAMHVDESEDDSGFDLVVPACAGPVQWLEKTEALLKGYLRFPASDRGPAAACPGLRGQEEAPPAASGCGVPGET